MTGEPLRILQVAAPARTGGLESVLVELSAGLMRKGHQVEVALVLSPGSEAEHPVVRAARDAGLTTHILVVGNRDYLGESRAIRGIAQAMQAQVVHTHGYRADAVHGRVARKLGARHVMTLHGFVGGSRRGRFYEWVQIQMARGADAVVAVSTPIVERLAGHRIGRNVHLIRNAVSPPGNALARSDARRALGLPDAATLVGWVGRVSHEKGPDLFVRSLAQCADDAHGVVVGDGPERPRVQQLAEDLGVADRITWLGLVPSASRYLAAFDVLALTSRTEGTPMILLEAMWAGVPIVATAVGGIPQLLSPSEAFLCTPEPSAIADALAQTLASEVVRAMHADEARAKVAREFSPDEWVERHVLLYRSLVD